MSSRDMKYFLGVLIVVTVTTNGLPALKQTSQGCDKACQKECLKVLNKYRANHDAPELQFSQHLADKAQHWADSGKFGYDLDYRGKYGQLIEWDVKDELQTFTSVIKHWHDKEKYYDFCKGRSANGQTLHDFTQVVWKKAYKAGCGRGTMLGSRYYVVWMDADGVLSSDGTAAANDYVGAPKLRDSHWFEVTAMSAVGEPLYFNCTNTTKDSPQKIRTKSSVSPEEEPIGNRAEEDEEKVLNNANNIKGYLKSDLGNVYDEENKEVSNLSSELDLLNETPPLISYDAKDQNKHFQGIIQQNFLPKPKVENQQLNAMRYMYNEKDKQAPNEADFKNSQEINYNGFKNREESTEVDLKNSQDPSQRFNNMQSMYMDEQEANAPNEVNFKNREESIDVDLKTSQEHGQQFHNIHNMYTDEENSPNEGYFKNRGESDEVGLMNSQRPNQQYANMQSMYMDEKEHQAPNKIDFKNREDFNDAEFKIKDESHESSFNNRQESNDNKIDEPSNQSELQNQLYAIDEGNGTSEPLKQQENLSDSNHTLQKISLESAFSLMDKPKPFAKKHHNSRPSSTKTQETLPKDGGTSTVVSDGPDVRPAKIWMVGAPLKPNKIHKETKKKNNDDVEEIKKKVKELWKVHVKGTKSKNKHKNHESDIYQDDNDDDDKGDKEKPEKVEVQDLSQLHGYQYNGHNQFNEINPMTGQPMQQSQNNEHMDDANPYAGGMGGEWFGNPMGNPQNEISPQVLNGPQGPYLYVKKYTNDEPQPDKIQTDIKPNILTAHNQKEHSQIGENKTTYESLKEDTSANHHRALASKDFSDILNNPERLQFHTTTNSESLSAHDIHQMFGKDSGAHHKNSESQPGFFNEDFSSTNPLAKEPNDPFMQSPNDQNYDQAPLDNQTQQSSLNRHMPSSAQTSAPASQQYQRYPHTPSHQTQATNSLRPPSIEFSLSFDKPTPLPSPAAAIIQHDSHNIQESQQKNESSSINKPNIDPNSKVTDGSVLTTSPYTDKQAHGSQTSSSGGTIMIDGRPIKGPYKTSGVYVTKGPFVYQTDTTIVMGGPTTIPTQQTNIAPNKEQTNTDSSAGNAINSISISANAVQTKAPTSASNLANEQQQTNQKAASDSGNKQQNSDQNTNGGKQDRPNNIAGKIIPSIFHNPSLLTLLNRKFKNNKTSGSNETTQGKGTTYGSNQIWKEPKVINKKKRPRNDPKSTNSSEDTSAASKEQQHEETDLEGQKHKPDSENTHENETKIALKEDFSKEGLSKESSKEQEQSNQQVTETMREEGRNHEQTSEKTNTLLLRENEQNNKGNYETDSNKVITPQEPNAEPTSPKDQQQSGSLLNAINQNHLANNEMTSKMELNPTSMHQDANVTPQTKISFQTLNDENVKASTNAMPPMAGTANVQSVKTSKPMISFGNLISRINHALGLDSPGSGLKVAAIALSRKENSTSEPYTALNNDYVVNKPQSFSTLGNTPQHKIPKIGHFWLTKNGTASGPAGNQLPSVRHSGCVDTGERCSLWQQRGYCTDVQSAAFMRTHCKYTCGYCAFPKVELQSERSPYASDIFFKHDCKDLPNYEFSCPVWKAQGYCQRRQKEMSLACRSTCNFCRNKPAKRPQISHDRTPVQPSSPHHSDGISHASTGDFAVTAQTGQASQPQSTAHAQDVTTFVQTPSSSTQQSVYTVASPAALLHQANSHAQMGSSHGQQSYVVTQSTDHGKSGKITATAQQTAANLQSSVGSTGNSNIKDEDDLLEDYVIKESPEYQHHENQPEQYYVTTTEGEAKAHAYQSQPGDGLNTLLDSREDAKMPDKKESLDVVSTKGCNLSCQKECLATINSYRRNHDAPALQLNQDLANHAQKWADTKSYGHSPWSRKTAELIAVGSFYKTFTAAIKAWHDEEKNFDWTTGKSKNGGEIKHFKQLVAKDASLVGCGKTSVNGEPYYILHMNVSPDDSNADDTGNPKTPDVGWYSASSPYWKDLQGRGQIPANIHQRLI